jgi:hypothetical protein
MNETDVAQVLTGDWEASFPRHYQIKAYLGDAGRLRDLAKKRTREYLTEAELAELPELRRRIKRADADSVLLLILNRGGYNFV